MVRHFGVIQMRKQQQKYNIELLGLKLKMQLTLNKRHGNNHECVSQRFQAFLQVLTIFYYLEYFLKTPGGVEIKKKSNVSNRHCLCG